MAKNKQQHWVSNCFLKPWVDPNTPAGQTPYLHVFDRYGANYCRKSPSNLFKMADLYTIFEGTERNLRIEQAFSRWESDFVRARGVIEALEFGTDEDVVDLYVFAGAMIARPPYRIDFQKKQWASIADRMRSFRINPDVPPIRTLSQGPRMDLAQVQEQADNPMGTWFPEIVAAHIDVLSLRFGCDVLVNRSEDPFLTSDAPAAIYHPPITDPRFRFMQRGLGSPGCEITLPVSPRFALLFRHKAPGLHAFINANRGRVFEVNFRTITRAQTRIVSDRPDIYFVKAITQHVAKVDGV